MKDNFVILLGIFGTLIVGKYMSTTIAERLNNPMNIKFNPANDWVGQIGKDDQTPFAIFSDPVYSVRAAFKILRSYQNRGISTIRDVISTYAPPSDNNDTENYIKFVSARTGIHPDAGISDRDHLPIIAAMGRMESGKDIKLDTLMKAKAMI